MVSPSSSQGRRHLEDNLQKSTRCVWVVRHAICSMQCIGYVHYINGWCIIPLSRFIFIVYLDDIPIYSAT